MNHSKSKHGEKLSCNVCHKTFSKISNLKRHKESAHGTTDSSMEEYKNCLKMMRKDNLVKHIRPCLRKKERNTNNYLKSEIIVINHL